MRGGREYREVVTRIYKRLGGRILDMVIVGFAIASELEVKFTHPGVTGALYALAPLWTLPLLLRRRFPVYAPAASYLAIAASAMMSGGDLIQLTMPFFAALLATAIVGSAPDTRDAFAGAAIAAGTLALVVYKDPKSGPGELFWVGLFFGAAWGAGRALATRSRQASELRSRAEVAELRAREAVNEERQRISRELHDVIAHSVSVMVVQSGAVRRLLRPDQERERDALVSVEGIGREALTEMRRMLGILREPEERGALSPQPSLERVDALVEQVREAGLPVQLKIEGCAEPLPPGVDLCAFRIVQEALTNTLKHAGPAEAEVLVRYAGDDVELEVLDNGQGSNGTPSGGHGLLGMKERALLCGGTFETGVAPGGGFAVRASLPIHGSAA
jgi:signal transduction histidine kinase